MRRHLPALRRRLLGVAGVAAAAADGHAAARQRQTSSVSAHALSESQNARRSLWQGREQEKHSLIASIQHGYALQNVYIYSMTSWAGRAAGKRTGQCRRWC